MTPPILAITGKKNSGKTTLTVRLAATLTARGLRVNTIKHGSHTFNMDPEGTDTFRHYHEGLSERVAMISPDKFALVMRRPEGDDLTPQLIVERYMHDADIVLCEGFKASDLPKIEIYRRAAHALPLFEESLPNQLSWKAMVSDTEAEWMPFPVFVMSKDGWLDELADWVMTKFLPPRS